MRLYVALVPPPDAVAELAAAVAPLRPGWPGLRWTGPGEWHVTLTFLGEVDEAVLGALTARLEQVARRHSSLKAAVRAAGAFPAPAQAQVLWAGIRADERALAALAASVAAAARGAGVPPPAEPNRYQPHLTLAYCRKPANLGPLIEALAGFAGSAWTAGHIHLYRSQLGPGRRYDPVGSWPLR